MLSIDEVTRFLAAVPDQKMRAVLVTAYAAGLRVFEVVALRVHDIDNQRMVLRVADGKGRKERLVMDLPRKSGELLVRKEDIHAPEAEAVHEGV